MCNSNTQDTDGRSLSKQNMSKICVTVENVQRVNAQRATIYRTSTTFSFSPKSRSHPTVAKSALRLVRPVTRWARKRCPTHCIGWTAFGVLLPHRRHHVIVPRPVRRSVVGVRGRRHSTLKWIALHLRSRCSRPIHIVPLRPADRLPVQRHLSLPGHRCQARRRWRRRHAASPVGSGTAASNPNGHYARNHRRCQPLNKSVRK